MNLKQLSSALRAQGVRHRVIIAGDREVKTLKSVYEAITSEDWIQLSKRNALIGKSMHDFVFDASASVTYDVGGKEKGFDGVNAIRVVVNMRPKNTKSNYCVTYLFARGKSTVSLKVDRDIQGSEPIVIREASPNRIIAEIGSHAFQYAMNATPATA